MSRALGRAAVSVAAVGIAAACGGRAEPASAPRPVVAVPTTGAATAGVTPAPADALVPNTPAALVGAVDSMLSDPKWATAQWGVLVVDARSGDTLYTRNAGRLFVPASNEKIITGAVALARLGPAYRWRTVVAASHDVARSNGTLDGNLYVIGSGDPTVSDAMQHGNAMGPLRVLADSVWAHGVRRIVGDVVAWSAVQGAAEAEGPWKYGWEWDDLDTPSGAGVTELLFNDGVARVTVRGGAHAGASVHATVWPTASAVPVDANPGDVRTAAPRDPTVGTVQARWDYDRREYVFRGAVAVDDSVVLEVGIHDPRRAYVGALRDALRARGIDVRGDIRTHVAGGAATSDDDPMKRCRSDCPTMPRHLDTLAVLTSAPLQDVLPAMAKPSQNQIAESLFLTVGREGAGVASADSARRVVGDQLRAWGVQPERDAVVRDGSGLSRHDLLTPTALVRVLDAARRLPGPAFADALPIAGVDGTLGARLRGTAAAGRVRAKTGSLDRVRSLSGYAATADDGLLLFSILCNNYTVPSREVARVQDAIAVRLATLRVGAGRAAQ